MFKSQTVFVVGAGASCELGLPSGLQLKSEIAKLLNITFPDRYNQKTGDRDICECLRAIAGQEGVQTINPLLHKAWHIRDSLPLALSIDNFLDAHKDDPQMEQCGKLAIAKSIANAERGSILSRLPNKAGKMDFSILDGTWLLKFFQMLTENVRKENLDTIFDNIKIITFNYDRCVEQFLPIAITQYYGIPERDAEELCRKLIVIHPYGRVGTLPWQQEEAQVPFGAEQFDLLAVSPSLRTFAEGMADPVQSAQIQSILHNAETIVYLGFAFHPMNMDILRLDNEGFARNVFATTFGLSKSDCEVVEAQILDGLSKFSPQHIHIPLGEPPEKETLETLELDAMKSGDFLGAYFRSISA